MARIRIPRGIFNDPNFAKLTDDQKIVYFNALAQANRIGLFWLSAGVGIEQLGWDSLAKYWSALERVCEVFGWKFDQEARVLWIPSWWWKHQVVSSDRALAGFLKDLNDVPRTELLADFAANTGDFEGAVLQRFRERVCLDGDAVAPLKSGQTRRRKAISKRLRFAVLKRCRYACVYCGRRHPEVQLEIDHVVPVAKGGTDDPENLVAACFDCNAGKSDTEIGEVV